MNSIQISIEANEEQQEILISELSELADGFEQKENMLIVYFGESNFKKDEVNKLLKGFPHTVNTIKEINWNQIWESNFEPVVINGFCAIRADFHEHAKNVQHEIVITPKMSFGTGHHATTYMMIAQMEGIDFRNKAVFDFGTGTGILAILAEKLGASKITAIDIDDWSIANARENIERNGCSKISLNLSSQIPKSFFDVILGNINRNVILNYLPQLGATLKAGGYLLLSGLLSADKEAIIEAGVKEKLSFVKDSERSNWMCLLFIKSL